MDIITISNEIQNKITELGKATSQLRQRTDTKSEALAEYDKQLALVIMGLKNGKQFQLEGETIHNPLATVTEKIAKGICWEYKLKADKAETEYKSLITAIDSIKSQLNGYQSIYRHLEEK